MDDAPEGWFRKQRPHDFELDALRIYAGDGAIRVRETPTGPLLERCHPGDTLWSVSDPEREAVVANLLPRLWRDPPEGLDLPLLSDAVKHWEQWKEGSPQVSAALEAQAAAKARELAATQDRLRMLHGDFHPGNVLSARREPWLAIDPKPVIGEPAYDLAHWILNHCETDCAASDPATAIGLRIGRLASHLDLDPRRITAWSFVKAAAWGWGEDLSRLLFGLSCQR